MVEGVGPDVEGDIPLGATVIIRHGSGQELGEELDPGEQTLASGLDQRSKYVAVTEEAIEGIINE